VFDIGYSASLLPDPHDLASWVNKIEKKGAPAPFSQSLLPPVPPAPGSAGSQIHRMRLRPPVPPPPGSVGSNSTNKLPDLGKKSGMKFLMNYTIIDVSGNPTSAIGGIVGEQQ